MISCHGSFDKKHWVVPRGKRMIYIAESGVALDSIMSDVLCASPTKLAQLQNGGVIYESGRRMSDDVLSFRADFLSGVYALPLPLAAAVISEVGSRGAALRNYLQTRRSLIKNHNWQGRLSDLMESPPLRDLQGTFYLAYCRVLQYETRDNYEMVVPRAMALLRRSFMRNGRVPLGPGVQVNIGHDDQERRLAQAFAINNHDTFRAKQEAIEEKDRGMKRLRAYEASNPSSPYLTQSKALKNEHPLNAEMIDLARDGGWMLQTRTATYPRYGFRVHKS